MYIFFCLVSALRYDKEEDFSPIVLGYIAQLSLAIAQPWSNRRRLLVQYMRTARNREMGEMLLIRGTRCVLKPAGAELNTIPKIPASGSTKINELLINNEMGLSCTMHSGWPLRGAVAAAGIRCPAVRKSAAQSRLFSRGWESFETGVRESASVPIPPSTPGSVCSCTQTIKPSTIAMHN